MRAVVYDVFGPPEVLHPADLPAPAPKRREVLVRVRATSVGFGDRLARNLRAASDRTFHMPAPLLFLTRLVFGFSKPRVHVLGSEFSGVVETVGEGVTRFRPGDEVFGYLGPRMGAYAELVCLPEDGLLAPKPACLTHEQAAVVPYGALMATSLLGRVPLRPGHKVLIIGASGSIGAAAVQLAKLRGAEVTGVCGAPRMAAVRALGADRVVDYATEDFTGNGETYDLILDVLGQSTYARCRDSLAPAGVHLLASFKTKAIIRMLWTRLTGRQRVICALATERVEDLRLVGELIAAGRYTAIVDRCFPLERAAEAHRYAESGARTGSIAITLTPKR